MALLSLQMSDVQTVPLGKLHTIYTILDYLHVVPCPSEQVARIENSKLLLTLIVKY